MSACASACRGVGPRAARRAGMGRALMSDLDERVRALIAAGDTNRAVTFALRELGPEVLGFLTGVLGSDDEADEVFASLSERLWRSLSGFESRCSVRTWVYILARHEIGRYRCGMRRHEQGRVPISELQEVLEIARTTRSTFATDKQIKLARLRDALSEEDRALLILRVDRNLAWHDIALVFADTAEAVGKDEQRRESARLRKRFQLIKERLVAQVRDEGAVTD
jgi:RNA polymerase sigma-70 factor, ECF subfamily